MEEMWDALQNAVDFRNPEYYRNRELSWLQFDGRCLSEARDRNIVPLFERIKFLSITASNLDEFNMVRVASLKDQVHAGYKKKDIAGLTAGDQLALISAKMQEFVKDQYTVYNRSLVPSLLKAGLEIIEDHKELTEAQCAFLDTYFEAEIYPILTPMAMDPSRPFPLVRNKTLNIGALIAPKESKKKKEFPDYTLDELMGIFDLNLKKYDYVIEEETRGHVREKLASEKLATLENFANARAVRNLFEEIITNQARRVAEMENPTLDDLKLLTNDDLVDPEEEQMDAVAFVNSLAEDVSREKGEESEIQEPESEETDVQEPESEASDVQEPETDSEE